MAPCLPCQGEKRVEFRILFFLQIADLPVVALDAVIGNRMEDLLVQAHRFPGVRVTTMDWH